MRRAMLVDLAVAAGALILLVAGVFVYMLAMPGPRWSSAFTARADEQALRDRLAAHVEQLAGVIGARSLTAAGDGLDLAERYVSAELTASGYDVQREAFTMAGIEVANVVAELAGTAATKEIVIVGAHYDAVDDVAGADDNASGVAALLELARAMKSSKARKRTIRFVAFVNEEPPYFQTERMGSLVHATRAKERGEQIVAMLSVESIGFYRDTAGSQAYPPPFSWFYPDRGDFIAFVGDLASRSLVRRAIRVFRETTEFPSEGIAAPSFISGVGWSDQWSFWMNGWPGLMVTDTAPFRNPHYHSSSDLPATLDYARMARVVEGLARVTSALANE